jgi:hypothetical protein
MVHRVAHAAVAMKATDIVAKRMTRSAGHEETVETGVLEPVGTR